MQKITIILVVIVFSLIACQQPEDQTKQESKKDKKWFEKPMRIAALQNNFGEDDLAIIDKWVDMGFNVEQLFHPIAEGYAALYDPNKSRKILTEYVKEAHKKNLKIILYLNIHILYSSIEKYKDNWSQRKKDGSISYMYETYPSICLNSPWKDYFYSVLDSLKNIDIDGIFLDGPVITNGGCYCQYCKAKYKEKYHENLTDHSEHKWDFYADTKDKFLQKAYDYWKKDNPDKVFYMNLPVEHTHVGFVKLESALKYNDILGTEGGFMFYGPAKNAFLWRPSFTSKLLEAVAPNKPRVIFMAADHKPWSWWQHSPLETKLCIASVTANAANIWYGLHGSSILLNTSSGNAVKNILGFYKNNEAFLDNTESATKVALLYSFTNRTKTKSDFADPKEERNTYGDSENALRGYYTMLTESHTPFDIITDFKIADEKLESYKVIILPNILAFDKKTENVLRNFVKNGGLLISELGASLFNERGEKNKDFSLSDVFGVSTSGKYSKHKNYNYFVLTSNTKLKKNIDAPYIPLPLLTVDIKANKDAEIICKAIDDLPGRYVTLPQGRYTFATSHNFGNGEAIYFAGDIGEMYNEYHVKEYRTLLEDIIFEKIKESIEFVNAPTNLEVVLRKQNQNLILHLINYQAGPTRPFEKVSPITNLIIKIPKNWNISQVISKQLNSKLKSSDSNKFKEYVLPEMNEYELLVLVKGK